MNSCLDSSLRLFASPVVFVELHVLVMECQLLDYRTMSGHFDMINMSWSMYQNEETMASSDENSPDVKLIYKSMRRKNWIQCTATYHAITLLYSHRKPKRGIAISCNGHWMTFSMKALILGDWNQSQNSDKLHG